MDAVCAGVARARPRAGTKRRRRASPTCRLADVPAYLTLARSERDLSMALFPTFGCSRDR